MPDEIPKVVPPPIGDIYQQLVDGVPDAIVVVDALGTIRLVNRQVEALLGYPREAIVGKAVEALVPRHMRERHAQHRAAYASAPSVRTMGSGLLLTARHADGHEVPVEISLGPVETPQGLFTVAAIRDVSERRRLEEQTRRTMLYLGSAVESIGEAFALVDEDDRVVLVNSAARELFHHALDADVATRSFGDILDGALEEVVSEQDRADDIRDRWLAYHREPVGSLELHTNDGRTLRVTERRTAEGGAVMLVADVSADRMRADELRRAREQAEAANAAKSEFLASMSHELRTPLNAVLGFTQLLQRDRKTPLTERQQERLAHVVRGGEHLLKLIDDVLDLARIEAGRVSISAEPVTIDDVLFDVRASLEPAAQRAKVSLAVASLPPDIAQVRADRTRLCQILINFGSNAVKYGREGGHVEFRAERRGPRVRVAVRDDGIGIAEAHKARIFEPFHRAGQEAGSIEGTGIGLTISKRLAELMDGSVGFTSQEGQGSEFWVEVPVHASVAAAPRDESALAPAASPLAAPGPRRLVVYIEDNPSNVAFMRDVFADLEGLELATVANAELGLDLVSQRLPAVVLMDLNLPGMSGIEATRRLAANEATRHIPVVALTAAAMLRDATLAAGAGFYRYLTKPVRIDELLAVLEELLAPR